MHKSTIIALEKPCPIPWFGNILTANLEKKNTRKKNQKGYIMALRHSPEIKDINLAQVSNNLSEYHVVS